MSQTAAAAEAHPGLHEGDPNVLEFKTPEKNDRPWQLMTVDGHPVHVREPKSAYFLTMAQQMIQGDDEQQVTGTNEILMKVFDEEARTHLQARLADDDDDFDTDELGDILNRLQEHWGKGRGGSARGSAGSSRGRAKHSTARRR